MTQKAKTESEIRAWDIYAAAAIAHALQDTAGTVDQHKKAVKKAAEIADLLLEQRRVR